MITNLWDLATLERPSRLPCERSMPPVCWFGKIISTLFLKNKNHEKLQRPTYVSSNVNVWHFSMQLLTFNSFAFACKYIDISFVGTCFFAKFAIFYDISLAFTFSSLLTFILQVLVFVEFAIFHLCIFLSAGYC